MLPRNLRMEALCRGYVQVVAGRSGMTCSSRDLDFGMDLTIHDIRKRGRRISESGYQIDVQAKSTTILRATGTDVVCDLPVSNYDDLRDEDVIIPRLLILLVLPRDESEWVLQTEEHLQLHHGAYWLSLMGWPHRTNRGSVRVRVPRMNLFTSDALMTLMDKARRRLAL